MHITNETDTEKKKTREKRNKRVIIKSNRNCNYPMSVIHKFRFKLIKGKILFCVNYKTIMRFVWTNGAHVSVFVREGERALKSLSSCPYHTSVYFMYEWVGKNASFCDTILFLCEIPIGTFHELVQSLLLFKLKRHNARTHTQKHTYKKGPHVNNENTTATQKVARLDSHEHSIDGILFCILLVYLFLQSMWRFCCWFGSYEYFSLFLDAIIQKL